MAELFTKAGQNAVCVCLDVNDGGTHRNHYIETYNLADTDLLMNPDGTPRTISLTYFTGQNHPPKTVDMNRHFQVSWASQTHRMLGLLEQNS